MSALDPKSGAKSQNEDGSSVKSEDSSTNSRDPVESETLNPDSNITEEEEEEEECGFCVFMKGGGCKESFIAWENCVEEAEKNNEDIVTKCMEITSTLKQCMDAHSDYYQPILAAEKAAEEQVKKEMEDEKISEEKVQAQG